MRRASLPANTGGEARAIFEAVCIRSQQAVQLGPACSLRAIRDVELAIDVREVELHRLLRHPEHLGERCVRVPLGDQLEDLPLAPRQVDELGVVRRGRPGGDGRRPGPSEVHRVLERLPNGGREVVRMSALDHVRDRPCVERLVDELRLRMRREDDCAQFGHECSRLGDALDPVDLTPLHLDPRHEDVGSMRVDQFERMRGRRGLAGDANVDPCEHELDRLQPERLSVQ